MGDDVEEDEDADEGRDLVPIPLVLTPSLVVDAPIHDCIERRRWLVPMVANIREQVMLIFFFSRCVRLFKAFSIGRALSIGSLRLGLFQKRQGQPVT